MNKRFLKLISIATALVMCCAVFAFAAIPPDVADSGYSGAIIALIEAGVITGSDDGPFHPLDNLTRAQACIIIVKAIDPPNADLFGTPSQILPASGFSDMRGYGWAENYVGYAVRQGIVNGYPGGTFQPGNNVTSDEMLTMVLRASGIKDSEIGSNWPEDFVDRAIKEGITKGLTGELPVLATKEIAALMAYNKLDVLREIGETGGKGGDALWGADSLTFATGRFNSNMTEYAGTSISKDVTIYTYGIKANYSKDMKLPSGESELRKDTINKYKLTETPCFYIKTGKEITTMLLPVDAGFTGRVYCVINGYEAATDGKGDKVTNVHTLAAAQPVSWLTKDVGVGLPDSSEYLKGEIYELTMVDGTITRDALVSTDAGSNTNFKELTPGTWETVLEFSDRNMTITTENGGKFSIADNTVIYVLNSDGKSYKAGKITDIRKGAEIRAFSITDENGAAQYITVNNK